MADRMTVVIQGRDGITVEDAMRQVLDTFDLVSRADPDSINSIKWDLVSATTNSPLTIVAEAKPVHRGTDVRRIAARQKAQFRRCVLELREGRVPSAWNSTEDRKKAKSWLRRTKDSVKATIVETDDEDAAIEVTALDAVAAENALELPPYPTKFKDQLGSIEGFLTSVETHYHKPAIRVRDRKSGASVLCIVPEEFRAKIASAAGLEDIWRERRVFVRGTLHYGATGKIDKITANVINTIEPREVQVSDIHDPNFSDGLPAEDYIDKVRDGDID
jgi:hypothetical protein